MPFINLMAREINCKIVYYGPGLCGKTTNLEFIHGHTKAESRGKLVKLAAESERTLYFDFLPFELGEVGGFKTRLHLYTVPGQVYYDASRKLILKGIDGCVFVADSQMARADANEESLDNLRANLVEYGLDLDAVPFVMQYNKRDLPSALSLEELRSALNPRGVPEFEAVAHEGTGVFETLRAVGRLVFRELKKTYGATAAAAPASAQGVSVPIGARPYSPSFGAAPSASGPPRVAVPAGLASSSVPLDAPRAPGSYPAGPPAPRAPGSYPGGPAPRAPGSYPAASPPGGSPPAASPRGSYPAGPPAPRAPGAFPGSGYSGGGYSGGGSPGGGSPGGPNPMGPAPRAPGYAPAPAAHEAGRQGARDAAGAPIPMAPPAVGPAVGSEPAPPPQHPAWPPHRR